MSYYAYFARCRAALDPSLVAECQLVVINEYCIIKILRQITVRCKHSVLKCCMCFANLLVLFASVAVVIPTLN